VRIIEESLQQQGDPLREGTKGDTGKHLPGLHVTPPERVKDLRRGLEPGLLRIEADIISRDQQHRDKGKTAIPKDTENKGQVLILPNAGIKGLNTRGGKNLNIRGGMKGLHRLQDMIGEEGNLFAMHKGVVKRQEETTAPTVEERFLGIQAAVLYADGA
jgi:hypothetical protein